MRLPKPASAGFLLAPNVAQMYNQNTSLVGLMAFSLWEMTGFNTAVGQGIWNINTAQGLASLNSEVAKQAATLACLQDFRLMMWITLSALPLILFLKTPAPRPKKPKKGILDRCRACENLKHCGILRAFCKARRLPVS